MVFKQKPYQASHPRAQHGLALSNWVNRDLETEGVATAVLRVGSNEQTGKGHQHHTEDDS